MLRVESAATPLPKEQLSRQGADPLLQGSVSLWEFPQVRGTLFWGPYNKDPTMYT